MTLKQGRKETQVFPSTKNSAHWRSFPKTFLTLSLEGGPCSLSGNRAPPYVALGGSQHLREGFAYPLLQ